MNIQEELRKLNELRDALLQKASGEDHITALEKAQPMVRYGSKAHETLLGSGYGGMTKADAEQIIKERSEKPELWPYSELKRAKAFLAALSARPKVSNTRKPWRTRGHARTMRG